MFYRPYFRGRNLANDVLLLLLCPQNRKKNLKVEYLVDGLSEVKKMSIRKLKTPHLFMEFLIYQENQKRAA